MSHQRGQLHYGGGKHDHARHQDDIHSLSTEDSASVEHAEEVAHAQGSSQDMWMLNNFGIKS